ncbi:hypothetical protein BD626DRAFT_576183 [Schizophyllum amplum]|uniref:Zn(2)-C6 fungal-type domain-containing protein n=1 Tax=Schizophyllum amplum TaxID=97359 RepID=A0A550BU00_9AGAR|nr:hypothetical protein BD626DRAFT_576183 [Auriculariopsis ampla]
MTKLMWSIMGKERDDWAERMMELGQTFVDWAMSVSGGNEEEVNRFLEAGRVKKAENDKKRFDILTKSLPSSMPPPPVPAHALRGRQAARGQPKPASVQTASKGRTTQPTQRGRPTEARQQPQARMSTRTQSSSRSKTTGADDGSDKKAVKDATKGEGTKHASSDTKLVSSDSKVVSSDIPFATPCKRCKSRKAECMMLLVDGKANPSYACYACRKGGKGCNYAKGTYAAMQAAQDEGERNRGEGASAPNVAKRQASASSSTAGSVLATSSTAKVLARASAGIDDASSLGDWVARLGHLRSGIDFVEGEFESLTAVAVKMGFDLRAAMATARAVGSPVEEDAVPGRMESEEESEESEESDDEEDGESGSNKAGDEFEYSEATDEESKSDAMEVDGV